jgi:hypothetical protein
LVDAIAGARPERLNARARKGSCDRTASGSIAASIRAQASLRPEARVKTARERADERREQKLELIREQVEAGSLVIRTMTDEERERYPPRVATARRATGRRSAA